MALIMFLILLLYLLLLSYVARGELFSVPPSTPPHDPQCILKALAPAPSP